MNQLKRLKLELIELESKIKQDKERLKEIQKTIQELELISDNQIKLKL
jgi:hypothetical protein